MRDVSMYEQSILPLYPNHLFFWQTDEPKICCKTNFYHFLSHLHIQIIVMCGTLEQEV